MSEICSKTGLDTGLTISYLNMFMSLGIVKKEMPFGTDSSRKTIYVLEDSMFRFWYRFIPDNLATINRGLTDAYLFLFAKTGFTKGCIDKARGLGNVELVTFDEIMK